MNIIQKQQQRELEKIAGDEYNRDGDRWIWHLFLSGCIDLPV